MDKKYMALALELAEKGEGFVNPNPMVGAVIVNGNKIIGQGYHMAYGGSHAEVEAIKNASESVEGSTMYVTLEPCSHHGQTPPCADLIVEKGIKKVVIAMLDPNPLVAGRGVKILREAGLVVVEGVLREEAQNLNRVFTKYITRQSPYVIIKTAMSLDGKIASRSGDSKWISSEASRREVHRLRHRYSGILVGVNTVIGDDPELTCRLKEASKNPTRIVLDSRLRVPLDSKILKVTQDKKTIIVTTPEKNKEKEGLIKALGVKVLTVASKNQRVDISQALSALGNLGIDSLLVEGGSDVNFSMFESNNVDQVISFVAPMIIGGRDSKTPVGGKGFDSIRESLDLGEIHVKPIGNDLMITAYVRRD